MPNLFLTQDVARAYFWQAVRNVCPEAFDDLASLVDDYMNYLTKTTDQRQDAIDQEAIVDGETNPHIIDFRYDDEGTIYKWQKRWNLGDMEERIWVAMLAINNLAFWAYHEDYLLKRWLIVFIPDTPRPC